MPSKRIPDLDRKKGLYLKHVGIKGRGVFCRKAIRAGDVLEVAPAVILNQAATRHADKTILLNYTFMVGNVSKSQRRRAGLKKTGKSSAVIMGIMSFCNHGEHPNAEILWEERDGTLYYILEATKAIPKNTEICTVYGRNWFEDRQKD
jgi:SET domain-containing protein